MFVIVLGVLVETMGSGSNDAGVDDDDDDEEERDDSSDDTAATDTDATATSVSAVMRRCSRGLAFGIPLAPTPLLLIRAPPIAH